MIETPTVVETPAQLIAIVHIETPRSQMQHVMGPGIAEVMSTVRTQGIGPTGPWFAHHFKMTPEAFDFEICVPVSAPAKPIGRVKPGKRLRLNVVRTVYHGPCEGLAGAWHEFGTWTEVNRHRTASDLYECYLVGPETSPDSASWCTEQSRALLE